jgi:outer membrane biosynthesis protein TonB
VKPETKPAPVAKTKPAPVAKTKPAPVAKTKPAPVAKTKPAPVAKTKPAPVAKPATVAKTKTAPDPGSAKDTDAVAVLAGSIRLKSDDASTASVGTSAVKPPPSIAATALDGQYLGRTSGRPLTLTLTFSGEDSVTAEAKVTSGGTTSAQALSGTYALATDGSASVVLFEQETDSPWVYSGSVSNDTFSGRITIAGKDRGKFNARR